MVDTSGRPGLGAIALLLIALVAGLGHLAPPPAEAAEQRVRITSTTYLSQGKVRLAGTTSANVRTVWVQVHRNSRWTSVMKAGVTRNRFSVVLRQTSAPQKVRVLSTGARSPVTTLRALASDECGVRPFKRDGKTWRCTFADDFTGEALDRSSWTVQTNFATGDAFRAACHIDSSDVVSVSGGRLRLSVREAEGLGLQLCTALLPSPITRYVAGMVSTYRAFSQQYGRFEARMKSPAATGPGLQEAFWLWPDDRVPSVVKWPAAGEIDIAETYSAHPDLAIPYLHYTANDNGGPVPGLNTAYCQASRGTFHTYTLVWEPTSIEILVDGKSCLRNTTGDDAFRKPYIVLFTQGLGQGLNAYRGGTQVPATLEVDYVRVWR